MIPLHFGRGQRLFGVAHPPAAGYDGRTGIVLCYPYGQDYVYAFRAFRTLAARLARAGVFVLRFDYSATGDSGDDGGASVSQWTTDVADAIDQVRSEGCTKLLLLGFRLGAVLAAQAAVRCGGIDRLVLWEPVIDGTEYVASLMRHHQRWFRGLAHQVPTSRKLEAPEDLLGFRLTETLRAELEQLNLLSLDARPANDVLVVSVEQQVGYPGLSQRLRELGCQVDVRLVDDQKLSTMDPGLQIGLVPNRVLAEIEGWLRTHENA